MNMLRALTSVFAMIALSVLPSAGQDSVSDIDRARQ
jgi:hypothetical protein